MVFSRWEEESSKFNQSKGKEELEKVLLSNKDNINSLLEQSNDLYSYDSVGKVFVY